MKERLHLAERSQLNFAAAASHELRTPLHQLNAAATLLRSALLPHLSTPRDSPTLEALKSQFITAPGISSAGTMPAEDRVEALAQLEIIEANGLSLGNILENIIDTLDIGRLSSRHDVKLEDEGPGRWVNHDATPAPRAKDFGQVLEKVVTDALALESKSRRVQGGRPMDEVEVILEVTPRQRGGWMMTDDSGPLVRHVPSFRPEKC